MPDKYATVLTSLSILFALGAGGVMALQPAVNGRLAGSCTHPLQASIISFGTGFLALAVVGMLMRVGLPDVKSLSSLPAWAWTGGLLGTYMVTVSLLVAPGLGATRWMALVLTGQITLSIVLDHYGLIGYEQHSLTWQRAIGVILLIAGMVVVMTNWEQK